jgi:hypothetical protein
MFCFKCGASMPDDSKVCPQCANPVESAPAPPPAAATPPPASAWLNVPPAQPQYPQGQSYPPQGQYYPPQGQPYGQQAPTDGKATTSLVLGILSVLCFGILTGIPAIILGHISRGNIRRSMGRLSGSGMAMAGLIMGYFSIFISLLFIASLLIPNLVRSRISANESAAQSTVRMVNTSQVTYVTNYPDKGYAPDLATLGPGPGASCGEASAEHACLLDNVLGNASCTAGAWCPKYGYRFSLSREGDCAPQAGTPECTYVVVATPVSTGTGSRSFCSTSDAVIHYRTGFPLTRPITAEQCLAWSPV